MKPNPQVTNGDSMLLTSLRSVTAAFPEDINQKYLAEIANHRVHFVTNATQPLISNLQRMCDRVDELVLAVKFLNERGSAEDRAALTKAAKKADVARGDALLALADTV